MPQFSLAALLAAAFLFYLGSTGRLRFIARECDTAPRRAAALLLLGGVLTLAVFFPVTSAGHAASVDPEVIWFPSIFAGHVVLVAALAAWWLLAGRPDVRAFLVLPPQDIGQALRTGIAAGLLGWVITIGTMGILAAAGSVAGGEGAPGAPEVPPIMFWLVDLPVAYKLAVIGVAMTVEECFFRAFLQSRLGLWLSSLLFALAHFSYGLPFMVIAVLTISLVIGTVFRRTGNVVPCMAAHGVFDAIQLLVVLPAVVSYLR